MLQGSSRSFCLQWSSWWSLVFWILIVPTPAHSRGSRCRHSIMEVELAVAPRWSVWIRTSDAQVKCYQICRGNFSLFNLWIPNKLRVEIPSYQELKMMGAVVHACTVTQRRIRVVQSCFGSSKIPISTGAFIAALQRNKSTAGSINGTLHLFPAHLMLSCCTIIIATIRWFFFLTCPVKK